jgi:hypothetical protein
VAASCCSSVGRAVALLNEIRRMQMKQNLTIVAWHRLLVTTRLREMMGCTNAALPVPACNPPAGDQGGNIAEATATPPLVFALDRRQQGITLHLSQELEVGLWHRPDVTDIATNDRFRH